jgi:hypothetical protein
MPLLTALSALFTGTLDTASAFAVDENGPPDRRCARRGDLFTRTRRI